MSYTESHALLVEIKLLIRYFVFLINIYHNHGALCVCVFVKINQELSWGGCGQSSTGRACAIASYWPARAYKTFATLSLGRSIYKLLASVKNINKRWRKSFALRRGCVRLASVLYCAAGVSLLFSKQLSKIIMPRPLTTKYTFI